MNNYYVVNCLAPRPWSFLGCRQKVVKQFIIKAGSLDDASTRSAKMFGEPFNVSHIEHNLDVNGVLQTK